MARARALALVAAMLLPAASSVSALPGTAAASPATYPTCFQLLAGSPRMLVYAPLQNCSDPVLVARDESGTTRTLGTVDLDHTYNWSLSGNMLTAYDEQVTPGPAIRWWNVVTGETGVLSLPGAPPPGSRDPGPRYVSAEPDGVLFLTVHGVLKLESTAGVVTRWTRLFRTGEVSYTYASDFGVVLSDRSKLRYVRFDDPGTVHVLKDGGSSATKCLGMSSVYAACVLRNVQRPQRYKVLALIPLDGSALIETRDRQHHGTGPVALAGRKTLFWLRLPPPGVTGHNFLTSRRGDATQRVRGPVRVALFPDMVSAYREAVVVPAGAHKIIAATTARRFKTVVTTP